MLTSLSYLNHKTIGVRGRELGGWVTAMVAGWLGGWHSVPDRLAECKWKPTTAEPKEP